MKRNRRELVSVADLIRLIDHAPSSWSTAAEYLQYHQDDMRRVSDAERVALSQQIPTDSAVPLPPVEDAADTIPAQLQPVYWCVSEVRSLIASNASGLATDSSTALSTMPTQRVAKQPLAPMPLMSNAEVLRQCQTINPVSKVGRRVDVSRLVTHLSRGEALRRLPRKRQKHAAAESVVLLDTSAYLVPVHDDLDTIARTWIRTHGRDLTRLMTLPNGPQGVCIEQRGERLDTAPELPERSRVFVLSDFGEGAPYRSALTVQWSRLVDRLSRAGHHLTRVTIATERVNPFAVDALVAAMSCLLLPCPRRLRHLRLALGRSGVRCSVTDELRAWNHVDRNGRFSQWTMNRVVANQWQEYFRRLPVSTQQALYGTMIETRSMLSDEAALLESLVDFKLGLSKAEPPESWQSKPIEWMASDASSRRSAERWFFAGSELLATVAGTFSNSERYASLFELNTQVAQRHRFAPAAGLDHVPTPAHTSEYHIYQTGAQLCVSDHEPQRLTLCRLPVPCLDTASGLPIDPSHEFNGQDVTIQTRSHEIVFTALRKPTWACEISRRKEGVWAEHESGLVLRYREAALSNQSIGNKTQPIGGWVSDGILPQWMQSAGVDAYGLWTEFTVKKITQRLRWIPPGEFLMGSPAGEPEREGDEGLHRVTLTQGYWLAETACTQALWEAVMGSNPSEFKGTEYPVENVSWDEVKRFIEQLNDKLPGLQCRLPTEAEWEYAARAGSQTPFWWGSTLSPEQANYAGIHPYDNGAKGQFRKETVPVKEFEPNPWGLYQVHGNVWEWSEDWYGEYESGSVVNPRGAESGGRRVCRGGSWDFSGWGLRAAFRDYNVPGDRGNFLGFRLSAGQSRAEPR